jgi:hypothetical protein
LSWRSFSRPVSFFKSVFFSPIIILFLQYSHKRSSHVPEMWPIVHTGFDVQYVIPNSFALDNNQCLISVHQLQVQCSPHRLKTGRLDIRAKWGNIWETSENRSNNFWLSSSGSLVLRGLLQIENFQPIRCYISHLELRTRSSDKDFEDIHSKSITVFTKIT